MKNFTFCLNYDCIVDKLSKTVEEEIKQKDVCKASLER